MKRLQSAFLRGFFTLLPIGITLYILYTAVLLFEKLLGSFLEWILGPRFYIPGLGFVLTLALIIVFGVALNNFIVERLIKAVEAKMLQVPFVKAIYSPLRDVMNLFSKSQGQGFGRVVLFRFAENTPQLLGVITREQFRDLGLDRELAEHVTVYVPFSYALGGYTFIVPRHLVQEVNVPIDRAMSLAITGWVKTEEKANATSTPDNNGSSS